MKVKQVIEIMQAISSVANRPLPVKIAYRLSVFAKKNEAEINEAMARLSIYGIEENR